MKRRMQADGIDHDLEQLSSLIKRSMFADQCIAEKVGAARGHRMSKETVSRIRNLEVRRSQNYTMQWVGWAVGYSREWRKI